jgi:TDG/mug DNA glycosylase family protein
VERDTVQVYEEHAEEWRDRRPATLLAEAQALGASVSPGGVVVDLGCGSGGYLPHLPRPTVALDAASAMLRLALAVAPDAWAVQADLEALPFRRGAIRAGWGRASYLHVRPERLPLALGDLHRVLAPGAPVVLTLRAGEHSGELEHDDFPGRWFAGWRADGLRDVLDGAGFTVVALGTTGEGEWLRAEITRARSLPDTVGPGMRVLVCGLNPSVRAADAGVGFVTPGNRFWPAAIAAGLVSVDRDPRGAYVTGMGMTDVVKRATPRAEELALDEYRVGFARVERLVRWLQPGAVCFVGLAGWRAAVDRKATPGVQPGGIGDRPAYLMPSTSGLNARTSLAELVDHLRAAAALGERHGVSR